MKLEVLKSSNRRKNGKHFLAFPFVGRVRSPVLCHVAQRGGGVRSAVCSAIITIMPSAEAATYMVTRCTVNTRYTRYTRYSDHFCCKNIPARCNLHCIFPCPLSSFWRVSAGCEMPVSISLRDVIVRGPRF